MSGSVVLAESGLPDLGGLDVDQALLAHVGRQVSGRDPGGWQRLLRPSSTADRRAQRALREDIRAAKESLSSHPQTDVPLPEPFEDVLVTRGELEALIRPNLLRSVELLDATVRSAGLSRDRLAGVYLVGGSSRIPLVATLIAEQLRIVPTNLDQPETAVALGAHHMSPEGTSLRTENLPDAVPAVAATDERTTRLAPPPRPGHQNGIPPRTGRPPVPQPQAPQATLPPSHAAPQAVLPVGMPDRPAARRRPMLPWLIGAVVMIAALVGAAIVYLTAESNVENPKQVAADADCGDIFSEEDASKALDAPAERRDIDGIECTFVSAKDDPLIPDFRIAIERSERSLPDETEFEGFPASRIDSGNDECVLVVKVRDDPVFLLVQVFSGSGVHVCGIADEAMRIALDNLSGA